MRINKTQALRLLRAMKTHHYPKVFTVSFVKRTTGERRTMNCRFGVKKNLTGTGTAYDPKEHHLMTCFDMQKRQYRTIALEHVLDVTVGGKHYVVSPGGS